MRCEAAVVISGALSVPCLCPPPAARLLHQTSDSPAPVNGRSPATQESSWAYLKWKVVPCWVMGDGHVVHATAVMAVLPVEAAQL
jgi:hypothetical protein